MSLKSFLKNLALKIGLILEHAVVKKELTDFINRFREKYESVDLIRVGEDKDGGYLLPNILQNTKYCFSPGVGDKSYFESQLSKKYNVKVFMADASVDSPSINDKNFYFIKKFLGSRTKGDFITLSDWISENISDSNEEKILQMDIEGSEYEVLSYESAEILSKFTVMVIEFHGFQRLFEKNFLKVTSAIFEKLYQNFSICHVHPNNFSGLATVKGISVPKNLEITFVRNDLIKRCSLNSKIALPHDLDKKNVQNIPDIVMPEIWWKSE